MKYDYLWNTNVIAICHHCFRCVCLVAAFEICQSTVSSQPKCSPSVTVRDFIPVVCRIMHDSSHKQHFKASHSTEDVVKRVNRKQMSVLFVNCKLVKNSMFGSDLINFFTMGFKLQQSTFKYHILFTRNLNFSTWFTKNFNIMGTKQDYIMNKWHFLGETRQRYFCMCSRNQ
jgi:hypothetical protein